MAAVLLVGQLFLQLHTTQHVVHDDADGVCLICLAANPAGAGLPAADFQFDLSVVPDTVVEFSETVVSVSFLPIPPARGPPSVIA